MDVLTYWFELGKWSTSVRGDAVPPVMAGQRLIESGGIGPVEKAEEVKRKAAAEEAARKAAEARQKKEEDFQSFIEVADWDKYDEI